MSKQNEIFKCRCCGMKYPNGFCATKDVGLCRWCSGEEIADEKKINNKRT